MGGGAVPRAEGSRAGPPAQPERLPLRARGRGRVDGGRHRPGGHAPRGPAADPGHGLAWPPQQHGRADGLARRAGHTADRIPGRDLLRAGPGGR